MEAGALDPNALRNIDILEDLSEAQRSKLAAIVQTRTVRAGEYVFLLGDAADRLYVVLSGRIDLCFPLSIHGAVTDVCVEPKLPDQALGWSALVRPYRFTLSARAAELSELAMFTRQDLLKVFEADPVIGFLLTRRIAEVVGRRLLKVQALWVRALQRDLANGTVSKESGNTR